MTRKISLVAVCCSAPWRISRAWAAMVFFSAAMDAEADDARGFGFDLFGVFLDVVFTVQKPVLDTPVWTRQQNQF